MKHRALCILYLLIAVGSCALLIRHETVSKAERAFVPIYEAPASAAEEEVTFRSCSMPREEAVSKATALSLTIASEKEASRLSRQGEAKNKRAEIGGLYVAEPYAEAEREEVAAEEPDVPSGFDGDDLFCLAAVVCQEAGGESEDIRLLVANVVMNRVRSASFPNTVYGVATQYMQYGMMWKYGVSFPSWADGAVKERCYAAARRILSGERVCPPGVVFQAEFPQGSGTYAHYDGFYFCFE